MKHLISASELAEIIDSPQCVIVDCRHDLLDPTAGSRAYQQGHLPGAVFAHMDHELSGHKTGQNGRHPLPEPLQLARSLSKLGIGDQSRVVAYDSHGGMYAARLWWLLRWLGHEHVQVLDGGLPAWQAAGLPLSEQAAVHQPAVLTVRLQSGWTVDAATLEHNLREPHWLVIDARAPGRYAGEGETIDPVAGHIPGARNRFFQLNLASDGCFKPAEQLREEWLDLLQQQSPAQTVQQCGSGVTACHNLLALELAGLPGARLYPGSWSEWCSDARRPVATGAAP